MSKIRSYAGIGSRETPEEMMTQMMRWASLLARDGWRLHSGGAPGADEAFEQGCPANERYRRIYLPWSGFQSKKAGNGVIIPEKSSPLWSKAQEIAARHHPAWDRLKPAAKTLMTRNVYQILGDDLDSPVEMVLCWSKSISWDEKGLIKNVAGGTGQAVRLAYEQGVKVYHLGVPEHILELERMLETAAENAENPTGTIQPTTTIPSTIAQTTDKPTPTGRWLRTPVILSKPPKTSPKS